MSDETFLEEQLRRIRQMSERMSEVQSRIRDFRSPSGSQNFSVERAHAQDRPKRRRQSAARRRH